MKWLKAGMMVVLFMQIALVGFGIYDIVLGATTGQWWMIGFGVFISLCNLVPGAVNVRNLFFRDY